jgi:uncharacterized protein
MGELFDSLKLSRAFQDFFMFPMASVIWTTQPASLSQFPAQFFLTFFNQHGLLDILNLPTWYNIPGGCAEYLSRLTASFSDSVHTNRGAISVIRDEAGVTITDTLGRTEVYEKVVFACHPDEILRILSDASAEEGDVFKAFSYSPSDLYIHTDPSFMPKTRTYWSSWVYTAPLGATTDHSSLTYWVNSLQGKHDMPDIFISINPAKAPEAESVLYRQSFAHPCYTHATSAAQEKLSGLQGKRDTWFCGAYTGFGFHEDGLVSGFNAARGIDAESMQDKHRADFSFSGILSA